MIRDGFKIDIFGVVIVILSGIFFLTMLSAAYGWLGVLIWIIGFPIFAIIAGRPVEYGGPRIWEKKEEK